MERSNKPRNVHLWVISFGDPPDRGTFPYRMSSIRAHPHLRLVGVSEASDGVAHRARQSVTRENHAAATNPGLDPTDPRWVLAVRAYSQLQGSSLTPTRRQRLIQTAGGMGVRPFDANLIIAIVQDHARRGKGLGDAAGTVALLEPPPQHRDREEQATLRWAMAILSAVVANIFLIWWLTG